MSHPMTDEEGTQFHRTGASRAVLNKKLKKTVHWTKIQKKIGTKFANPPRKKTGQVREMTFGPESPEHEKISYLIYFLKNLKKTHLRTFLNFEFWPIQALTAGGPNVGVWPKGGLKVLERNPVPFGRPWLPPVFCCWLWGKKIKNKECKSSIAPLPSTRGFDFWFGDQIWITSLRVENGDWRLGGRLPWSTFLCFVTQTVSRLELH